MNWGYKIALAYTIFVLLILGLVYISFQQNIDLVTEDYYEKELEYQTKIDKKSNISKLSSPVTVEKNNNLIVFQFPDEIVNQGASGTIYFYRPDDKKKDLILDMKIDNEGIQKLELSQFSSGYYKIKIEWTSDGIEYYQEENIFI